MVEPSSSVRMVPVHKLVLEQGGNVTGLTVVVYVTNHNLALFKLNFKLVVETDQPKSNS